MIVYCDVKNCIYNEYGKCGAGKTEIADGECVTFTLCFAKKERECEYCDNSKNTNSGKECNKDSTTTKSNRI